MLSPVARFLFLIRGKFPVISRVGFALPDHHARVYSCSKSSDDALISIGDACHTAFLRRVYRRFLRRNLNSQPRTVAQRPG
jgi:hypothetical protein